MFSNLKFSKEPVLWLATLVVIIQAVIDLLDGGEYDSQSWWNKILIAGGALIARQAVTPNVNVPKSGVDFPSQPNVPTQTKPDTL